MIKIKDTDYLFPLHQDHLHSTSSDPHYEHHHGSSFSEEEVSIPSPNHTLLCPSFSSSSPPSPESLSILEDFLAFPPLLVSPYSSHQNPNNSGTRYNPHSITSSSTHKLLQHCIYDDHDEMSDINTNYISQNMLLNIPSLPDGSNTSSFLRQTNHQSYNSLINATNSSSFYPSSFWPHPCCDLISEESHFSNGCSGLENRQSLLERFPDEFAVKSHLTANTGNPFLPHYVSEKACEPLSKRLCSSTRKREDYDAPFDMDETTSVNITITQQESNETCIGKPRSMRGSATDRLCTVARNRRARIRARMKILQNLVPSADNMDIVTMLDKAIGYVKFLQMQIKVLSNDEYWSS